MKNKQKIILILVPIIFIVVWASQFGAMKQLIDDSNNLTFNDNLTGPETITIKGIITKASDSRAADGDCTIEVDNKWKIVVKSNGFATSNGNNEIRGSVEGFVCDGKNTKGVGKKVEVYAEKESQNKLSISELKHFYIKVKD